MRTTKKPLGITLRVVITPRRNQILVYTLCDIFEALRKGGRVNSCKTGGYRRSNEHWNTDWPYTYKENTNASGSRERANRPCSNGRGVEKFMKGESNDWERINTGSRKAKRIQT